MNGGGGGGRDTIYCIGNLVNLGSEDSGRLLFCSRFEKERGVDRIIKK